MKTMSTRAMYPFLHLLDTPGNLDCTYDSAAATAPLSSCWHVPSLTHKLALRVASSRHSACALARAAGLDCTRVSPHAPVGLSC